MNNLLSDVDASSVIGVINPPVDDPLYTSADPNAAIGKILSTGIQIFFFVAAITAMIFLFLGALDWITSGGEKEKISKAQNKIMNAVIGLVLVVVVFVVFTVIMGTVLGGKFGIGKNMEIKLPTINNEASPEILNYYRRVQ